MELIDKTTAPESIMWNGHKCLPVIVMDSNVPTGTIFKIGLIMALAQAAFGVLVIVALIALDVI